MKVAVANLKGGTAKTLTAFFLATAFARRGRTLLVDTDPQGSALSWAESAEEDGGRLPFSIMGLPTRDIHKKLKGFESDYEHIVVDTPPGDLAIARAALLAADVALVAIPPTKADLDRVVATLEAIAEVEPVNDLSFHVLLTRVRRISREARDTREAMGLMDLPVMASEIPLLSYYSDAFGELPPKDLGEYECVARELLGEPVGEPIGEGKVS